MFILYTTYIKRDKNLFTFFKKKQKDCTKLKFVHIHLLSRLILKCDFKLFCLQSFAFYLRHARCGPNGLFQKLKTILSPPFLNFRSSTQS